MPADVKSRRPGTWDGARGGVVRGSIRLSQRRQLLTDASQRTAANRPCIGPGSLTASCEYAWGYGTEQGTCGQLPCPPVPCIGVASRAWLLVFKPMGVAARCLCYPFAMVVFFRGAGETQLGPQVRKRRRPFHSRLIEYTALLRVDIDRPTNEGHNHWRSRCLSTNGRGWGPKTTYRPSPCWRKLSAMVVQLEIICRFRWWNKGQRQRPPWFVRIVGILHRLPILPLARAY